MSNKDPEFETTPEQIQKMMGAVGKTVFEHIILKMQEVDERFKKITYYEYKYMMETAGLEVEGVEGYQKMVKLVRFSILEMIRRIKEIEDDTSEIVAKLALEKLSNMTLESISDEEWINLANRSKVKA